METAMFSMGSTVSMEPRKASARAARGCVGPGAQGILEGRAGQGWGLLGYQGQAASLLTPPLWAWASVGAGRRRVGLLLRPLED